MYWIINTYPVRRVSQHLESFDSILLKGTLENQKASKCQPTLYIFPCQLVDLKMPLRISKENVCNEHDGTLSIDIGSISFVPRARTRLPRLLYHLYVASYHSGTLASMVLIVSGAPFTATSDLPFGRVDTVDIRLSAEEN